MKTCSKCKRSKPLDKFTNCKRRKDGKYPSCKDCRKSAYDANIEEIRRKDSIRRKQKLEYRRQYDKKRYSERTDELKLKASKWAMKNPHKRQVIVERRRARKANATGSFSSEQWKARLAYYGGKCIYCGTDQNIQIEHRIPLSRGGTNWPSNLVPACQTCNCRKGTKTEKEFKSENAE